MEHLRCIKVKFLGPTNTRGSRVKITEDRLDGRNSITLSYDYEIGNCLIQAQRYLESKGINCIGYTELNDDTTLFLSDSWMRGDDTYFKSII